MKTIELTKGKYVLVDDEDYDYLNQWDWYAYPHGRTFYAVREIIAKTGIKSKLRMHRVIVNAKNGEICDHRDGNGLNNQRANLRKCSHQQNTWNSRTRINNTSGQRGVRWDKDKMKWRSVIGYKNKKIHLGYFDSQQQASDIYNRRARDLFGEYYKETL